MCATICVLMLLCVRILLYMCAHTTIYVSSYYYICVLILLYMCAHTTMCPHTAIYVSSYSYMSVRSIFDDASRTAQGLKERALSSCLSEEAVPSVHGRAREGSESERRERGGSEKAGRDREWREREGRERGGGEREFCDSLYALKSESRLLVVRLRGLAVKFVSVRESATY